MSQSTRRRFLQAAAVGAVPLLDTIAQAGEPPANPAAALTALVRQRFKHLTEDQVKAVQAGLQRNLAAGEILKRFALDPVDEPATIFVSDVAE